VPAVIIFFAVVQLVYYGLLGASRQHPLQSIMVFDLGGISHFAQENQFPVSWNESEQRLLLNGCYRPTEWDIYWRLEPCEFVMHKIEREKGLFGTSAIPKAWLLAMARHPIAYLEHRSAFMWNFLAGSNPTMWVADIEHPPERIFQDRPAFTALVSLHDALKPTPLFRAGSWLVLCLAVCWFGWRWADTREGAFVTRDVRLRRGLRAELLSCRRCVRLSLCLLGRGGRSCGRRRRGGAIPLFAG
jgi:hypothetical protein